MKKLILSILAIAFLNGCESVDHTQNSYNSSSYSPPISSPKTQSNGGLKPDRSYSEIKIDDNGKNGDIGTREYSFKLILTSKDYEEGYLTIRARTKNGVFSLWHFEFQQVTLGITDIGGNAGRWPSFEAIKVGDKTFYIDGFTSHDMSLEGTWINGDIKSPQLQKMFLNSISSSSFDGKVVLVGENENAQLTLTKEYIPDLIKLNSHFKIDTSLTKKTPANLHRLKTANRRKYKHGNKYEIDNVYDKFLDFIESDSNKKWTALRYEKHLNENLFGKDIILTGKFGKLNKTEGNYEIRFSTGLNKILKDEKLTNMYYTLHFPLSSEEALLSVGKPIYNIEGDQLEEGEQITIKGTLMKLQIKNPFPANSYYHESKDDYYQVTIENCTLFQNSPVRAD
jgi:hypothetical protein